MSTPRWWGDRGSPSRPGDGGRSAQGAVPGVVLTEPRPTVHKIVEQRAQTHDEAPAAHPPTCGHRACERPGTITTTLRADGGRRWELHHCETHRDDGVDIAAALGCLVVPALSGHRARQSHVSGCSRDLAG